METESLKPVIWMGSTLKDLKKFPEASRSEVGFALYLAQRGEKATNAVPMGGFGSSKVLEVVIDEDGDTYRAVYTVKLQHAVYVLHAFQKKSKRGRSTPRRDINLIRERLRVAEGHHASEYRQWKKAKSNEKGA